MINTLFFTISLFNDKIILVETTSQSVVNPNKNFTISIIAIITCLITLAIIFLRQNGPDKQNNNVPNNNHNNNSTTSIKSINNTSPDLLRNYIKPELIIRNLKSENKEDAIFELLSLINKNNLVHNLDEVYKQVIEREHQMATGLNENIAIPHAKTNLVDSLVCAIGFKKDGINFGAKDNKKSRAIILTLCPIDSTSPYLHFMSLVVNSFNDEKINKILSCQTKSEIIELL